MFLDFRKCRKTSWNRLSRDKNLQAGTLYFRFYVIIYHQIYVRMIVDSNIDCDIHDICTE